LKLKDRCIPCIFHGLVVSLAVQNAVPIRAAEEDRKTQESKTKSRPLRSCSLCPLCLCGEIF
jgi:hypothetical protein